MTLFKIKTIKDDDEREEDDGDERGENRRKTRTKLI